MIRHTTLRVRLASRNEICQDNNDDRKVYLSRSRFKRACKPRRPLKDLPTGRVNCAAAVVISRADPVQGYGFGVRSIHSKYILVYKYAVPRNRSFVRHFFRRSEARRFETGLQREGLR